MENQINFQDFDKFQRRKFADRLTTVISNFYPFYKEAFVLGLNAKFGTGKTTFLKMWQNQLQEDNFTVIYINAWETDFDDEPLIPIISALLDGITTGKGLNELRAVLRGTLGTVALAGNDFLEHISGINVNKILEEVETDLKDADIQELGKKLYKEYSFKKKAYNSLRSELSAFIENIPKKPLVVFVDELDRVRPDYSVKFLEAIKHIFSIQGVCFVLAVDRDQIEASIRQLYGEIDFENYYRRFVTREAQLPEVSNLDLNPFIQMQAIQFFDEKRDLGIKFSFKPESQQDVLEFISVVCKVFRFVPRQIETLFRIFSQLMAVVKTDQMAKPAWVKIAGILIAIFIDNRSIYYKIGNASVSPDEFYKYIKELNFSTLNDSSYERYIILLAMASCMRSEPQKELNQILDLCLEYDKGMHSVDNPDVKRQEMKLSLIRSLDDWGRLNKQTAFQSIYTRIEEWKAFIE